MSASDFLPPRGRPASAGTLLVLSFERELTHEDVYDLAVGEARSQLTAAPPLQKLTVVHRQAARLIAQGFSAVEVAHAVGRTPQRIRDLQIDPSFAELVAYYTDQMTEADVEDGQRLRTKLADLAEVAIDELAERLDDDKKREQLPAAELRQIASMGLDRTIAPPRGASTPATPPTQITFNVGNRDVRTEAENIKDAKPAQVVIPPKKD